MTDAIICIMTINSIERFAFVRMVLTPPVHLVTEFVFCPGVSTMTSATSDMILHVNMNDFTPPIISARILRDSSFPDILTKSSSIRSPPLMHSKGYFYEEPLHSVHTGVVSICS